MNRGKSARFSPNFLPATCTFLRLPHPLSPRAHLRVLERLLTTQFTLGAEGAVAAGSVGRSATAQTDAGMRAEILSWSRSRGVFAGIALQGATLRQDSDDNRELYGRTVDNRELVSQGVVAPRAALKLLALLKKYSPEEHKSPQ